MADFSTIIQEINEDITTNGVGAITGAKLNQVLRDMIAAVNAAKTDILPDGALYGGFAWPNEPPTYGDDHRYFYLAYLAGSYPAFDTELDGDNLAIFYWLEDAQDWTSNYLTMTPTGIEELLSSKMDIAELYTRLGFLRFSPYSSYVIGDYVVNEGFLYKFTSNHAAGQWDEDDVAEATLLDYITDYVSKQLNGKQDVISDLDTIRSGAAAGATAYQKPSGGIPKTDLASGVQTSLGKADTAFQKPSGGIPASDLAAAVQTSLGKADTAIQDVSGKVDKVQAATAGNIAQFVSGGNLENSGINSDDVFELLELSVSIVDASTPPAIIEPNKVYKYGTLSGNTTFPALETPAYPDAANVYCWTFTTPSTAPTITWPVAITAWAGGSAPTINASKSYEVSVMDGLATIIEA